MLWDRARDLGRALLALAAFYAGFAGLAIVLEWGGRVLPDGWSAAGRGVLAAALPALAAVLLAYAVLLRVGGWTPARLHVPPGAGSVRRLGEGILWGGGLALAVLGLTLLGGARLAVRPSPGETYLAVAGPVGLGLAAAALLEELLFRGFPLARLAEAVGPAAASVALTLGFVAAHRGNPVVSGLGLVNIGLASLLLSAVFFSPGGLPAAAGLHFGWNAGLALAADAPVSGLRFGLPALEYDPGPRAWLTGGTFGPEGGLAAGAVLLAALGWWGRRVGRVREVAR